MCFLTQHGLPQKVPLRGWNHTLFPVKRILIQNTFKNYKNMYKLKHTLKFVQRILLVGFTHLIIRYSLIAYSMFK